MRFVAFASRNHKELIRDPLNLAFGIGFPLALLLLLSAMQTNVPFDLFDIDKLAPGVAVFGLSFISLFSGTVIAKDRAHSFLMRLYSSPLTAFDFIFGYTMPLVPLAIAQSTICFIAAFFLGLSLNSNVVVAIIVLSPTVVLFIGFGLLAGSLLNDKQVGGVCGALLTNLSAWLSGTWFELSVVGGAFERIAFLLPFSHAVSATRAAIAGEHASMVFHLLWVTGYAIGIMGAAILVFKRRMNSESA